jgi:hypothetical protein
LEKAVVKHCGINEYNHLPKELKKCHKPQSSQLVTGFRSKHWLLKYKVVQI